MSDWKKELQRRVTMEGEDEFEPVDGEIENEEFKYLIGERVA